MVWADVTADTAYEQRGSTLVAVTRDSCIDSVTGDDLVITRAHFVALLPEGYIFSSAELEKLGRDKKFTRYGESYHCPSPWFYFFLTDVRKTETNFFVAEGYVVPKETSRPAVRKWYLLEASYWLLPVWLLCAISVFLIVRTNTSNPLLILFPAIALDFILCVSLMGTDPPGIRAAPIPAGIVITLVVVAFILKKRRSLKLDAKKQNE
jgi:hypothetical protein